MRSTEVLSESLNRGSGLWLRRWVFVVLILPVSVGSLFFSGCGPSRPFAGPVPDSTLVLILADLYVVDAAATLRQEDDSDQADSSDLSGIVPVSREQVLESHGVTDTGFEESMQPFVDDPARYVALYNQVLDRLNLIQRIPPAIADTSSVAERE